MEDMNLRRARAEEDASEPDPANASMQPPTDGSVPHLNTFLKAQKSQAELFAVKNVQYDDAISSTGVIGAAVEIVSIAARLKKICIHSGTGGEDFDRAKLIDLLKDAANQATIAMIMVVEDNWLGK